MVSDKLRLISKAITFFLPFAGSLLLQRIAATYHRWAYRAIPEAKTILVLGGSYAGLELVKRLSETLPTGYKCVLVEKNSHFNYLFNFPRFSVVPGHERAAFIPYDAVEARAVEGVVVRKQGIAVEVTTTHVILGSGEKVPYHVLVLATGSEQSLPAKVSSTGRDEACIELRSVQKAIKDAQKIAVVGAGAVGVEIVTDIADFYPEKHLTLIHSRGQLLNHFGKRLHDYVLVALQKFDIRVLLNERPSLPGPGMQRDASLTFSDGHTEQFDLVISCTGQRPNSGIIRGILPKSISPTTSRILVAPTLQVLDSSADSLGSTKPSPNIFAFGDVAEHHGPRMARAAFFQSQVVLENVLAVVQGRSPSKSYIARWDFEGAIKLTLGMRHHVVYTMEQSGEEGIHVTKTDVESQIDAVRDLLVPGYGANVDLDIKRAWKQQGADFSLSQTDGVNVSVRASA